MNQTPMQNNRKVNRVLYIVTVTLLFAIAVIIAITSAASRRTKDPLDPSGSETVMDTESATDSITTAPITTDRTKGTSNKPDTQAPPQTSEAEASINDDPAEPVVSSPPKFTLPTSGILSKGHDTDVQVYSSTMNDYRIHTGIDIVTAEGAPVYAAADGIVSQVWQDPLMGSCIAISHSGECYTVYKNLSTEAVSGIEEGANVVSGQLIASVGNTAMIEIAEEPHLHFEMTVGGKSADPLDYFDEASLVSLTVDESYES